jgi:hypothetical protein
LAKHEGKAGVNTCLALGVVDQLTWVTAMRLLLPLLIVLPGLALAAPPAQAQRQVPKIGNICPMGYVDMLNGKCSTLGLMNYTVQPTNGKACPSGWMNVGGNYCRKK